MVPKTTVSVDEDVGIKTMRLLDRIEELDDVQRVYTNADFPEAALEEYAKAS